MTAKSEDYEELAESIFKISNLDENILEGMGIKARKLAEKRYSRQIVIDKYNFILNRRVIES